jgi:HD-like signal output (HDOD) protein
LQFDGELGKTARGSIAIGKVPPETEGKSVGLAALERPFNPFGVAHGPDCGLRPESERVAQSATGRTGSTKGDKSSPAQIISVHHPYLLGGRVYQPYSGGAPKFRFPVGKCKDTLACGRKVYKGEYDPTLKSGRPMTVNTLQRNDRVPQDKKVSIKIDKDFEMPSIPVVLTKILGVIDGNQATARQLEEIILHDPSLSARILSLANSAFYAFRSEVKTISHAIALLGLNLVKSLAIGVSIFESFTVGLKKEASHINQLWMHSFGVGALAQEIWRPRTNRVESEFAFLCGLLHDMGKVVCFRNDTRRYSEIFSAEKQEEDRDICSYELERYGTTHATFGSILAGRWQLPEDLATVVHHHHDPFSSKLSLVGAVALADILAKQAGIGFDGDQKIGVKIEDLMHLLDMAPEEYEMLTVSAQSRIDEAKEFFSSAK